MTKKALGNDPFASNSEPTASKASNKPQARTSKRPASKTSKPPKESKAPRASKRPAKGGAAEEDLLIAAVPKVPSSAKIPVEATQIVERDAPAKEPEPTATPAPEPEPELVAAAAQPLEAAEPREVVEPSDARPVSDPPADEAVTADAAPVVVSEPPARNSDEITVEPAPSEEGATIEDRIRDLESQLDGLLAQAGRAREASAPTPAPTANEEATLSGARSESESAPEPSADELASTRAEDDPAELASSEYYTRQWGRVALRDRAEEVDEFGFDQEFSKRSEKIIDALYERWWRVQTSGVHNVPDTGRVILCANHAGAVPYDGLMLAAALRKEHPKHRALRWLADDFVFHFPFMGVALNRLGAVRACQENAERLLRGSSVVGVFPEGVKGVSKSVRERYQLQRFGRGGHIKLALRTRTPIVPVAIVGSEETHPMLPTGPIAKLLNVPFLPVTPTFPWLGPLGLIPLPSKWSITFLPPIFVDGYDKDAADDELLVGRLNEKVRAAIQDELSRRVSARGSVFR